MNRAAALTVAVAVGVVLSGCGPQVTHYGDADAETWIPCGATICGPGGDKHAFLPMTWWSDDDGVVRSTPEDGYGVDCAPDTVNIGWWPVDGRPTYDGWVAECGWTMTVWDPVHHEPLPWSWWQRAQFVGYKNDGRWFCYWSSLPAGSILTCSGHFWG